MNTIVRGTTPSLIVDFSGITEFSVGEIEKVALTIKRRTETVTHGLDDLEVGESTLSYHWSQEETLALKAGENISIDMHVLVNGERYKILGLPSTVAVENTQYNEVM
jgi:hypothetical protein